MERRTVLRLARRYEIAQVLRIGDRGGLAFEETMVDPDYDAGITSYDVLPSLDRRKSDGQVRHAFEDDDSSANRARRGGAQLYVNRVEGGGEGPIGLGSSFDLA
jgi:hypothetical protein